MPEEIKPALTPAQWSRYREDLAVLRPWALEDEEDPEARVQRYIRNHAVYLLEGGLPEEDAAKGAAAVLLHGQPFGFTWEDVGRIRDLASAAQYVLGQHAEFVAAVRNLADRIAALLPPREGA